MTSAPGSDPLPDPTSQAVAARDAGVRRIRLTTRWLVVGAVGLTGAIAGVAAQQTLPSDTGSPGANVVQASVSGSVDEDDDGDDGHAAASAPQAPAQAPQSAAAATPSTTSGAS